LLALRRGPDRRGAGYGALDQDQSALGVDGVHDDVLRGDAVPAHPPGHPDALEDAGRRRARPDGAGCAVNAVRAVAGPLALEAVALHDAGEALALAVPGDVDRLTGGEQLGGDLLARAQ
jgi:hypothetical protein